MSCRYAAWFLNSLINLSSFILCSIFIFGLTEVHQQMQEWKKVWRKREKGMKEMKMKYRERRKEKERKSIHSVFSSENCCASVLCNHWFFSDQMWQKQYIQDMTLLSKVFRDNLAHILRITFVFPCFFSGNKKTGYFGNWVTWIFA